jgi:translation initiation factor 4A
LSEKIAQGIRACGFMRPTPVQQHGIVPVLENFNDVLVQAPAGRGKTATFGVGALQLCVNHLETGRNFVNGPLVLVLEPTKALAHQASNEIRRLGEFAGVGVTTCVGGTAIREDREALEFCPRPAGIVVGTVGRVHSLIVKKILRLDQLCLLILDECDECLKMRKQSFGDQTTQIVQRVRQTQASARVAMFSATLRQETVNVCRDLLHKPVVYRPLTSARVVSRTVKHHFHPMGAKNYEYVDIVLEDLLSNLVPRDSAVRSWGSIIVFMEKTKEVGYVIFFFVFFSLHLHRGLHKRRML